jgi:hypothetical protein
MPLFIELPSIGALLTTLSFVVIVEVGNRNSAPSRNRPIVGNIFRAIGFRRGAYHEV